MKTKINKTVLLLLMDRAIQINESCPEACRYFSIMTSNMRKKTLLLRWMTINIDDIDNPIQRYYYECFHLDGSPQNCSVNYTNQQEANAFFNSLETHYTQEFANDHKQLENV